MIRQACISVARASLSIPASQCTIRTMAAATGPATKLFGHPAVVETTKVTADGGITKYVVKPGDGGAKPARGQKVTVHYTGKLDNGSKFDSSRDRGRPFQFKIGLGQVIEGWDKGVATMTKGEKAVLTATSDYAYGDEGVGDGLIPGGATLHFEVELLDFA